MKNVRARVLLPLISFAATGDIIVGLVRARPMDRSNARGQVVPGNEWWLSAIDSALDEKSPSTDFQVQVPPLNYRRPVSSDNDGHQQDAQEMSHHFGESGPSFRSNEDIVYWHVPGPNDDSAMSRYDPWQSSEAVHKSIDLYQSRHDAFSGQAHHLGLGSWSNQQFQAQAPYPQSSLLSTLLADRHSSHEWGAVLASQHHVSLEPHALGDLDTSASNLEAAPGALVHESAPLPNTHAANHVKINGSDEDLRDVQSKAKAIATSKHHHPAAKFLEGHAFFSPFRGESTSKASSWMLPELSPDAHTLKQHINERLFDGHLEWKTKSETVIRTLYRENYFMKYLARQSQRAQRFNVKSEALQLNKHVVAFTHRSVEGTYLFDPEQDARLLFSFWTPADDNKAHLQHIGSASLQNRFANEVLQKAKLHYSRIVGATSLAGVKDVAAL